MTAVFYAGVAVLMVLEVVGLTFVIRKIGSPWLTLFLLVVILAGNLLVFMAALPRLEAQAAAAGN